MHPHAKGEKKLGYFPPEACTAESFGIVCEASKVAPPPATPSYERPRLKAGDDVGKAPCGSKRSYKAIVSDFSDSSSGLREQVSLRTIRMRMPGPLPEIFKSKLVITTPYGSQKTERYMYDQPTQPAPLRQNRRWEKG